MTWSPPSETGRPVTSITVDPQNPSTLYAADGEVLKSVDGGAHWNVVGTGIPDGVTRIAVDPSNDTILYAISAQVNHSPLYRSADSGATWTLALDAFTSSVAPDPGNPGTVYASAFYAYRSMDYGATWMRVSADTDVDLGELACDESGVVYAAGRAANPYFIGVGTPLRSDDGGATFEPIGGWDPFSVGFPFRVDTVAVDRAGSVVYAGTDQGVWQTASRTPRTLAQPLP